MLALSCSKWRGLANNPSRRPTLSNHFVQARNRRRQKCEAVLKRVASSLQIMWRQSRGARVTIHNRKWRRQMQWVSASATFSHPTGTWTNTIVCYNPSKLQHLINARKKANIKTVSHRQKQPILCSLKIVLPPFLSQAASRRTLAQIPPLLVSNLPSFTPISSTNSSCWILEPYLIETVPGIATTVSPSQRNPMPSIVACKLSVVNALGKSSVALWSKKNSMSLEKS